MILILSRRSATTGHFAVSLAASCGPETAFKSVGHLWKCSVALAEECPRGVDSARAGRLFFLLLFLLLYSYTTDVIAGDLAASLDL